MGVEAGRGAIKTDSRVIGGAAAAPDSSTARCGMGGGDASTLCGSTGQGGATPRFATDIATAWYHARSRNAAGTLMLPLRVASIALLATLSTLLSLPAAVCRGLVKAVLPFERVRLACNPWLHRHCRKLDRGEQRHDGAPHPHALPRGGGADLRVDGHYLVLANHQSWVDIPVLQRVFNRRIPLLRFFLKRQLFWVPVLGLAWWALDFPFMRRSTRAEIKAPAGAGGGGTWPRRGAPAPSSAPFRWR